MTGILFLNAKAPLLGGIVVRKAVLEAVERKQGRQRRRPGEDGKKLELSYVLTGDDPLGKAADRPRSGLK